MHNIECPLIMERKMVEQEEHENLLKEVRVLTAVFCAAALVLAWPWERPWHRDTRSTATWGEGGGTHLPGDHPAGVAGEGEDRLQHLDTRAR